MNPSEIKAPQPPIDSPKKGRLASRYSVALNAPAEGEGLRPHQTNFSTVSSWPSPLNAAVSQPGLAKRLGELLRRHWEWVAAIEKEGPSSDTHQPHHTTILERHRIAIEHMCKALGGSFTQYAATFSGIADLALRMQGVYDLLALSTLAIEDNNAAVDLAHAAEVGALQSRIDVQREEIDKLSNTAGLLDRLDVAVVEERNLRLKLTESEQRCQKLTASLSEQHEQYMSLHQRCVLANAAEDRLKGVVTDLEERLGKSVVLAEALALEQEYLREKVEGQVEELQELRQQNGRQMKQLADFEERLAASQEELSRAERRAQMRGGGRGESMVGPKGSRGIQEQDASFRDDSTSSPVPRRAAGRPPTPRPNWLDFPITLKRHSSVVCEANRRQFVQGPIDFLASCGAVRSLVACQRTAQTLRGSPPSGLTAEDEAAKSSEGRVVVLSKALSTSHEFIRDLFHTVDALSSYAESMRTLYCELGVEPLETYKGMVDRQFECIKMELQATTGPSNGHHSGGGNAAVPQLKPPRHSIGNMADMDRSANSSLGDKPKPKAVLKAPPPPLPSSPVLCGHLLFHAQRGTSFGTIVVPSRLPPPPDLARAQTDHEYVLELSRGLWSPSPTDDVMLSIQKHLLRQAVEREPQSAGIGGLGLYSFAMPVSLDAPTKGARAKHTKDAAGGSKGAAHGGFTQVSEHPALFFPVTLLVDLYEAIYDYVAAQHLLHTEAVGSESNVDPQPQPSSFVEDFVEAVGRILLPKLSAMGELCAAQDKYILSVDALVASRQEALRADQPTTKGKAKKDAGLDVQWAQLGGLNPAPTTIKGHHEDGSKRAISADSVVYSLLYHSYRVHHRLPAARFFLLHLHGCIAKTSFLLLRRCLGAVRRRLHDVAPTSLVVAVPPPVEGGYAAKKAGVAALPTLSDVVAAVGEEVPFLAPYWLPMIHESILGDASTFALLVEGSHPFHYLLPSSPEYAHRGEEGAAMRLPADSSVPASALLVGVGSVADVGFQVSSGCVRTAQGQQFDLIRLMMEGVMRVEGSDRELLSLRTTTQTPCGPFVQMLTHALLTQQLWGTYSFQGALREVFTMAGGTLGAGLPSLLQPSDTFPEDAVVSYMSVQQAFEKADPSARPEAIRKLLADCARISVSDLAPRLKFSARGLAQGLLSVPYLRGTPLPLSRQSEDPEQEMVGVFAGTTAATPLPSTTTLPGLLKSFRTRVGVVDIGRDALRRRGLREVADEALIRFTSEAVHSM